MSVLAKNLKVIRRELRCTQSVMSNILKVGFRTYVRYEAGERDAPVAVLVKMAKLGNLSLEQLLTTEVDRHHISPVQADLEGARSQEARSVNFKKGQITFKNPVRQEFLTIDATEKKLLTIYRKMGEPLQLICIRDIEDSLRGRPNYARNFLRRVGRGKRPKAVGAETEATSATPKGRGRPGRKKVDKKMLKEKIDKLKMITGTINKITVR